MKPTYILIVLAVVTMLFLIGLLQRTKAKKARIKNGLLRLFEDKKFLEEQIEFVLKEKIDFALRFPKHLEQTDFSKITVDHIRNYFSGFDTSRSTEKDIEAAEKFLREIKKEIHKIAALSKTMVIKKEECYKLLQNIKSILDKLQIITRKSKFSDEFFESVSKEKEYYIDIENSMDKERDWIEMFRDINKFNRELVDIQHAVEDEERNRRNNKFACDALQKSIGQQFNELNRNIRDKKISDENVSMISSEIDDLLFEAKTKYDVKSYRDALEIYKRIENEELIKLKSSMIKAGYFVIQEVHSI